MTDDQFRQLRDDIMSVRSDVHSLRDEFHTLRVENAARFAIIETSLQSKADKADVFRTVFLVNGGFIAVFGVLAAVARTFGLV